MTNKKQHLRLIEPLTAIKSPEDWVTFALLENTISTQYKEVLACIAKLQSMPKTERTLLKMNVVLAIVEARTKALRKIAPSDRERSNLATDVLLAVTLDYVEYGTPLPVVEGV